MHPSKSFIVFVFPWNLFELGFQKGFPFPLRQLAAF
jgi:hypothetical protein